MLIPLVVRMHRHGRIAKQRFRPCRRDFKHIVRADDRIIDVPEKAVLLLILHFNIRDCGEAMRAPVDNALAAVNQPLLKETHEYLAHGAAAPLVKREPLALPIAGGTKLFKLIEDMAAVFPFPCPGAL